MIHALHTLHTTMDKTWFIRALGAVVPPTTLQGCSSCQPWQFFLSTSVTSLIVWVLTSSGVVLMFPLFSLFREMGLPGADERFFRVVSLWIGTEPLGCCTLLHNCIVLCNVRSLPSSMVYCLYNKSIPQGLPVWIFGLWMIWWDFFVRIVVIACPTLATRPAAVEDVFAMKELQNRW